MSLAVCLLLHFSSAPSWLPKNAFPYLLVVVSCCHTHGVVQCRLRSLLWRRLRRFGVPWGRRGTSVGALQPSAGARLPGVRPGDRPFFKLTVARKIFCGCPQRNHYFRHSEGTGFWDFRQILLSFCRLMSEHSIFRLAGVQLSV